MGLCSHQRIDKNLTGDTRQQQHNQIIKPAVGHC